MTPQAIIEHVTAEGVQLAVSASRGIQASGDPGVIQRWLPIMRERKAAIVASRVQRDWLATWRELASLTYGITAEASVCRGHGGLASGRRGLSQQQWKGLLPRGRTGAKGYDRQTDGQTDTGANLNTNHIPSDGFAASALEPTAIWIGR